MKYLLLIFTIFSLQTFATNPLRTSDKTVVEDSITELGFALFEKIDTGKENTVYSPFSVTSSLFVLSYGSNNKTNKEIKKALKLNLSDEKLPLVYNRIYTDLFISEKPCDFLLTNLAFIDFSTLILTSFKKAAVSNFHVKIEQGSFEKNQKKEIDRINKYIASMTEFKILNILSRSDISDYTRLLFINTLFMKGVWKSPFNLSETQPSAFFSPQGEITVYKMRQTSELLYHENSDFKTAALPIGCKSNKTDIKMLILLPKRKDARISNKMFKQIANNLSYSYLNIEIPRFALNQKYSLKKALKELGIVQAFTRTADFSNINDRLDLYLNNVIHESFLKIDENGINVKDEDIKVTEYKADLDQKAISFNVDRPFYIIICDLKSKVILFIGKIQRPYEFI